MLRVTSRILAAASVVFCASLAPLQPVTAAVPGGYLAPMSPGFARDIATLPADRTYGAFVHFGSGTPAAHRTLLGSFGLSVTNDFERYARTVFAVGPIAAFRNLSKSWSVSYLEDNQKLHYDMNTAPWATRVRVAQEAVSGGPYKDASGRVLRGQGVTIVVIDSGLNATHPDFAGRVLHNYKVVCPAPILADTTTGNCFQVQYVDVGQTDSDTTGGHGTHCAGIAAGGGQASTGDYPVAGAAPNVRGTHTGVAPDASIIAYGAGEGINMLWVAEAYQHLLDHWDPSIKVVSNSYGSTGPHDPNAVASILANAVVDKGATVLFSAGNGDTLNDGGTGADDRTRSQCKNPKPGVICVSNLDDNGTGLRDATLDFSSSRGLNGQPTTYPDIGAPGALITATCVQPQPGQAVCTSGETTWQPYYGTISGTSMSTPHVAGAVALLVQADPTLTPAQIEMLIQKTAFKVTTNGPYEADPQNSEATTNFGIGAGMLDLPAALNALGTSHGGTPASGTEVTILDGYTNAAVAGAANVQKLTMQEATVGASSTGIRYRLTLANATDFATAPNGLTYEIRQNVDGKHFVTRISATVGSVAPVDDGGSGVASSASRAGNVVTLFVPYVQLGSPPIGAPIHNIGVGVIDGGTGLPLNDVPHPANSVGTSDALRPMYGKPFSVQLASGSGSGPTENACLVPGQTIVTEGMGDNLPPVPGTDVRSLHVAQPYAADAASSKLVFTIGTDPGRAVQPPGTGWYVSFANPRDHKVYGARMVFRTASPSFESYVASGSLNTSDPNAEGQTDGRFADAFRPADPSSNYDHLTGKVTIVVPMADVGLQPGDVITGFNAASTLTTNPEELPIPSGTQIIDGMPDALSYVGSFGTYNAATTCAATASPTPRVTPTSLAFGTQKVGSKSGAQSVVYTNTWTKPLPVNAIAMVSQESVGEFGQTNDCPKTLPVGVSCTIKVRFTPLQAGARVGTMSIIANNGRRTDTVKLGGTGQ